MRKAILFLVLALGVFATAEAQKSPMQKEVLELYRRASLCKSQVDFASVSAEGEAYLNNNPGSPDRNRVIILLARSYRCFGKNEESVKYYKMVKESIPSMDPQQMRDIWDDRSAFDKFIIEADQFIEDFENPKPHTTTAQAETPSEKTVGSKDVAYAGPTLGASTKQIYEKFGPPSETQNGKPLYRKGDFVIMIGFTAGEKPVANNILYKKNKGSVFSRDEVEQLLKNNWGKLTYDEVDGSGMNMPGSRVFRLQKIHSFMARFTPAENFLYFWVTDDQKRAESAKQSVGNL